MIVPFLRWNFDMNILPGCDIIPSSSAYSFIKSPRSFLFSTVILKIGGGGVGKVCLQKFRNFEVALNVTKQLSTLNLSHESFFAERLLIGGKLLEDDFLLSHRFGINPCNCPPVINKFVSFLLDIFFAHLVVFPLLYPTHIFVVSQGQASFLTWIVVEIPTHCFKDSVTTITSSINTKAFDLFLSTSFNIAFNPTFRTSLLKIRKDHVFKGACFVQSRHEFLRFRVIVPSSIQCSRHWLTHQIGRELACVHAVKWLEQIRWFADKSFVNHSLACKHKAGTTNHIFTNLL